MEEPVAAPQGTEATPNTNPTPEAAPAAPAPAPAPAPVADIPADKIAEFNRFVAGNGGFEKAFAKLRSDVSTPAPQPAQQPEPAPQPVQQPQAPTTPDKIPAGYITQEEFAASQYYESLAREPGYAPIANQIRNGEIFKEMSKFGIKPMQNGAINDRQVRDFLNLYAKAQPAPVHQAPVTTTPTVEYVNVGDKITSREDALAVLRQNMSLGNNAAHPQTAAAREFLKQYFNTKK